MTDGLTLAYDFSDDPNDDFGWLTVSAEVDGFSGKNGFWVQWQDVVEFAERLSQYPLTKDASVDAEWGYSENEVYSRVTFISLAPSNKRGGVAVSVDLVDYYDGRKRCQLVMETTYANIATFREELERLMARSLESATLQAA